jgi:hypothetical protein
MDTIATLVDKLVIVHLKYWHFQDKVQTCKTEGKYKEFARIQTLIDQCNQDRNELMAEIDQTIEDVLVKGDKPFKKFKLMRFHDHNKVQLKGAK